MGSEGGPSRRPRRVRVTTQRGTPVSGSDRGTSSQSAGAPSDRRTAGSGYDGGTPTQSAAPPDRPTAVSGSEGGTSSRSRSGSSEGASRRSRRAAPDAPRLVAFDLLRGVDERDAFANLLLPALLRERRLSGRDAAFATELGFGALRGLGLYDAVLAACVDRPLGRLDPPVLDVLRLGAHQLLAMRVPPHAAVSATVELARDVLGDGRARFVNAVLRRVASTALEDWEARVAPPPSDLVGRLSVVTSHPRWVVSALRDALAGDDGELEQLLRADNEAPLVAVMARPGLCEVEELVAAGARPGRWSPFAAVLPSGDPAAVPAVAQGRARVQDEGSQLVALALAAAGVEGRDQRWLDLCAGPGGKSALLAGLARERGAHLVANELQPHRARLVARAVADPPGSSYLADPTPAPDAPAPATGAISDGPPRPSGTAVLVADGTRPPWRPATFDRVLVDAPCMGLGALRRRPEARWRRQPTDVPALTALQEALLGSAIDSVRPGGVVLYATCSPHLAETRVVVGDVVRRRPDVEALDVRACLPVAMPGLGDGPYAQLWPHRHGTDAMFLALLRRRDVPRAAAPPR